MEVKIYTKTNCPFCDLAKSWFGANDLPFTQVSLDDDMYLMNQSILGTYMDILPNTCPFLR